MDAMTGNYKLNTNEDIFRLISRLPSINQREEISLNGAVQIGIKMVDTVDIRMVATSSSYSPDIIKLQLDYMSERGANLCNDYYNYMYTGIAGNYLRAYRHMIDWGLSYNFIIDFYNFPIAMISILVVEDKFILCLPDSGLSQSFNNVLMQANVGYSEISQTIESLLGMVLSELFGLSKPLQSETYSKLVTFYEYQQKMIAEKKARRKQRTQEKKVARSEQRLAQSYKVLNI